MKKSAGADSFSLFFFSQPLRFLEMESISTRPEASPTRLKYRGREPSDGISLRKVPSLRWILYSTLNVHDPEPSGDVASESMFAEFADIAVR